MSGQANSKDNGLGRGMLWLAALAMVAGLTWMFSWMSPGQGGLVNSRDASGHAMVAVTQDRSGHYVAEGAINGQAVVFLLDTGATDVAISERMARSMGLKFGPEVMVMTAAGPVQAWVTRLDRVSLGELSLTNVRATISPGLGNQALLGMSFLKHFSLRQQGDTLEISSGEGTGV